MLCSIRSNVNSKLVPAAGLHRPAVQAWCGPWTVGASTPQARLARTHVCVVGAGSVGSIVLECLARTGFEQITVIDPDLDPDLVEDRNLDRLIYADRHCLGLRKAEVAAAHLHRIATARRPVVRLVPLSVRTERGYRLAADADRCAASTMPRRARFSHLAYANCLPLIDGGVLVESRERLLSVGPPDRTRHAITSSFG